MTKPGFRKGRPGGRRSGATGAGDGFLSSALFSQAQILHLMKNEFARARRHGVPLACVVLAVDRLPQLVDLYGLPLREVVRQSLATLVRQKTRGSDMLGLANEDRYLLMLPHTELDQARIVADRLHALFGELQIAVDGRQLALTLSVGIAAVGEQQTMFFDSLLAQAEAALEFAMDAGGDRVCSFGEVTLAQADTAPHDVEGAGADDGEDHDDDERRGAP